MRRVTATLALGLCLIGCSAAPSAAPLIMPADLIGTRCGTGTWIVGVIVADPQSGHAAIQDDEGVVTTLLGGWHNSFTPELGRRYKLGGSIASWYDDALWLCAGPESVIPQ